ncbi:MAG: hypothetical protein KF729_34370 [Sandaracinaceae bacterium]|nr:hypothetical protein [Sandaracinaceae bacterium]
MSLARIDDKTRTEPVPGGRRVERTCPACAERATFVEHRPAQSFRRYLLDEPGAPAMGRLLACSACGARFRASEDAFVDEPRASPPREGDVEVRVRADDDPVAEARGDAAPKRRRGREDDVDDDAESEGWRDALASAAAQVGEAVGKAGDVLAPAAQRAGDAVVPVLSRTGENARELLEEARGGLGPLARRATGGVESLWRRLRAEVGGRDEDEDEDDDDDLPSSRELDPEKAAVLRRFEELERKLAKKK